MRRFQTIAIPLTLITLSAIVFAGPAFATAQAPDVLEYGGKTYHIQTNPLSSFLAAHPDVLPKPEVMSSGLWRGYIATWSLGKDHLFLKDVRVPTRDVMFSVPEEKQYRSVMKDLFPETAPHVATWFTGHLIVPTGELVKYVHMGYGSTYSSYLVATIVEGTVRQLRNLDQSEFEAFRHAQFEAFKKTPEYANVKAETRRDAKTMSDQMVDDFLLSFYSEAFMSRIFEPTTH